MPLGKVWLLAASAVLAATTALAQDAILPYREYAKRTDAAQKVGPLTDAAFGADVSLYNGSTSFRTVDISLAGNSGIPVQLARTVQIDDRTNVYRPTAGGFADWELDVPYIDGTFALSVGWKVGSSPGSTARCSNPNTPFLSGQWQAEQVWHGYNMHIPDGASEQLLVNNVVGVQQPSDGAAYPWITKSGFRIKCLPTLASGTGEGFQAVGPDGTKYWFNWMVSKEIAGARMPYLSNALNKISRSRIFLFATRVEDRHGNWVTYTYAGSKLTQIASNDGRSIVLTWSGDRVISAAAAGKTWQYQYKAGATTTYANGPGLERVVLPDGSDWRYTATGTLAQLETWQPPLEGPTGTCDPFQVPDQVFGYTVKHPAGASTTFSFEGRRHFRTRIPFWCQTYAGSAFEELLIPNYADTISLVAKTLSGPGIVAKTWTYQYGEPNSSSFSYPPTQQGGTGYVPPPRDNCPHNLPCAPEDDAKYVTETESTGRVKRYTFGTGFDTNDGRLLAEEVISGGTVIRRTAYAFITDTEVASQSFSSTIGTSLQLWQPLSTLVRPVRHTVVTQQGMTFGSHVNSFDVFARSTSVREVTTDLSTGRPLPERVELIAYHDYTPTWTVGLPKSKQFSGQPQKTFEITYHPTSALPTELRTFGRLTERYTYNADGTLATVKNGRGYTTTLSNWYRGVPRSVLLPDLTSVSATVDGYGSITSVTDELGFSTSYSHDAMGRVTQITYPAGDTVAWAPTTVSFVPVAATEYDIPAGHWRQIVSRGNYRKETYFDGLWRPVLEREYDNAAVTATQRFKGWQYDGDGQVTFAGYPRATATSVASFTEGVTNTYDHLGRPTRVRQHSELGNLDTVYAYLSGFETQVTNPRMQVTTTNFQTFSQPDTSAPILIEAPEGQSTTIARDVYSAPLVLNRQGMWSGGNLTFSRTYVYDASRRLCKTVEPETGATVMDYDAASNVTWSAAGINSPDVTSPNACTDARTTAYSSRRRVDRTYDVRNRPLTLSFPDGRGNQAWAYFADGLPSQITTQNGPGSQTVVNSYVYNRRRLLTQETMASGGTYTHSYAYDANGAFSSVTNGAFSVNYAPNGLGQPTQAGSWAAGVQYFPNGAVKQFTYGNGLVHTLTQNARQLPLTSADSGGALNQTYHYDGNGNVVRIEDHLDVNRQKWLTYDGLDRLTDAGAHVFGGDSWHRFTYDALDNLRSWKLAGVKDLANYVYDGNNRLTNIQNSGGATVHSFAYDEQGNVVNKNSVGYDFDYGNRLRAVAGVESYVYDGHGRRAISFRTDGSTVASVYTQDGKLRYGADSRNGGAGIPVYLGDDLVAEVFRAWSNGAMTSTYQHTDALGSPIAVSNEAGTVIERTNYDPYGGPIGKVVDGVGYTGHVMDGLTGLTNMQQRYYDAGIGRFLSVDPVTANPNTGAMFNRYNYANNNPYKFTDPDGRQASCAGSPQNIIVCQQIAAETGVSAPAAAPAAEKAAGGIIGFFLGLISMNEASEGGEESGQESGGEVVIPDDVKDQLGERGWTEEGVREVAGGESIGTTVDNTGGKTGDKGEPASVYGSKDGGHVVVNDKSREVIQVTPTNDPDWIPDSRIDWKD